MSDRGATPKSDPGISEEERNRRLGEAYRLILAAGRRAARQTTATDRDSFPGEAQPVASETAPQEAAASEEMVP